MHITDLLVFGFLQSSKYNFHQELEALSQELPVEVYLDADLEDELQTDGSRASRSFYQGRIEPGRPRPCPLHPTSRLHCPPKGYRGFGGPVSNPAANSTGTERH